MNAQLKLKPNEQVAREVTIKNRRTDLFWIDRENGREILKDELQECIDLFLDEILKNYGELDACASGTILENCIANTAMRIENAKLAKEMRDEFLPSWRSRIEP